MSEQTEALHQHLTTSRTILLDCLTRLTEEQWQTTIFSDGSQWTAADILRHLVDAQRGMTAQIAQIQAGGSGVPEDFDLARWNARGVRKAQEKTAGELIGELEEGQTNLFMLLETIQEDDWLKKGRHGSGRILTIAEIFTIIATHEADHARDIRQTLNLN
ncbi:MAG: DinB family protein [Chloroflexi bacterium]|nr:DinB family protein [Chloroflexota bacterium]MBP8054920.1 DinB family protein [Chloroflexota bacterium]